MRRPARTVLFVASTVALIVAGCQNAGPVGTPTGSSASTPPGTVPAGPTATAEPAAVEAELEIGAGDFFLADPRVGLDAIASYTETLTVTFDGTADGQARSWSKTLRLQHTAEPAVSVLTMEASGDAQAPDPRVVAEADGTAYQLSAAGTCGGRVLDPADSIVMLSEPAGLLPSLLGAEAAGSEPANGVAANHYAFDGRALLESGGPVTAGEIWVAAEGGHVLRYLRTTTADAAYFGDGLDGKMRWEYGLSDVNGLTTIALPSACRIDAPIMTGATNVLLLPRYTGFDTQSSVAEVIAYYERELPALGWTIKSVPFKGDDRAVIEFGKGDQVMNLIITPTESGRRVDLALGSGG